MPSQARKDTAQSGRYSVFTTPQKRAIIVSASVLTLVSYMGSTMYYPALNQVRTRLFCESSNPLTTK